jgi:predicted transcriptional regulator
MTKLRLPPAERDTLACLCRLGEATARDIREEMRAYRPMAHGSALTLLKRLEAKKLVTRKKGPAGKAFVYQATRSRESAFRGLVRDLVLRVFHGDPAQLVASLFETCPPTTQEVEKLQGLLDDLRRRHQSGKDK